MNPNECIFGPEIGHLLDLQRRVIKRRLDHPRNTKERIANIDFLYLKGGTKKLRKVTVTYPPLPSPEDLGFPGLDEAFDLETLTI